MNERTIAGARPRARYNVGFNPNWRCATRIAMFLASLVKLTITLSLLA